MCEDKNQRGMRRSAPGNSKVNISYLSIIHCFISLILLWLSRCSSSSGPFCSVHRGLGTQRVTGGGVARKYSRETWMSSSYKVPAGPAPLLWISCSGRAPQKGRCGPLACCILARRLNRGHPGEWLPHNPSVTELSGFFLNSSKVHKSEMSRWPKVNNQTGYERTC